MRSCCQMLAGEVAVWAPWTAFWLRLNKKVFSMTHGEIRAVAAPALTALFLMLSVGIGCAEGSLQIDPTFGKNDNDDIAAGVVSISLGYGNDYVTDVAISPDGKILVVGHISNGQSNDIIVLSYTEDGVLDRDFGGRDDDAMPRGVVRLSHGGANDFGAAIAVGADGNIVVAGNHDEGPGSKVFVSRRQPDGVLDPSFGGTDDSIESGIVGVSVANGAYTARDLAMLPDGKIILVGDSETAGGPSKIAVMRLTSDGSPDLTFGSPLNSSRQGFVLTSVGEGDHRAEALVVQDDGKIVVVGHYTAKDGSSDVLVTRYDADGLPDTSFGRNDGTANDGAFSISLSNGNDVPRDLALQADGRIILLADSLATDASTSVTALRLTADGDLDKTFGGTEDDRTDGLIMPFPGLEKAAGSTITLQPDGKLVIIGTYRDGEQREIALSSYEADGTISQTFLEANAGHAHRSLALSDGDDLAAAAALHGDKVIVVGGITSAANGAINVAVFRLETQ